jgi:hypothetical protein
MGACVAGFPCHPAQEVGRAGGVEGIARRHQIDTAEAWRIEAHRRHAPRQVVRNVNFVERLAHEYAAGADADADIGLRVDYGGREPAGCRGASRREPGETRADNDQIELHWGRPPVRSGR